MAYKGGQGALSWGIFNMSNGTTIDVVVGQSGNTCQGSCNSQSDGGGGGGSFIWLAGADEPILAAGGGGGASSQSTGSPYR